MSDQKNVMFIIIDQLRADALFGELANHVDLPNLRALMGEAVTFKRNYSVTNPCGPSRVSILTGQYAMNHRSVRNGTPLRHDTPNLATEARKAGYMPMLFGYTDTSQDPRAYPPNDPALKTYEHSMYGFYEVVEMRLDESYPWRADLIAKGYDVPDYSEHYVPAAPEGRARRIDDPAFYKAEDSDTAFLTKACLTKLAARKKESWFSHLTYIRPHPPLVAPAPYNRMYDPKSLPQPARLDSAASEREIHPFFAPAHAHQPAESFVKGFPDLKADDDDIQTLRAVYLGLATEVDLHIGRVITFLKDTGQYDNTLLVVTADHGEMLGDRFSWGKMSVYDAAYHTPLIVRDPLNPQMHGAEVSKPTETIDITPTILDWMGQDIPSSMDGSSLTPFLSGGNTENWPDYSYSELDFANPVSPTIWQQELGLGPSSANLAILRGPRYSLVHFNGGLPPLLFDKDGEGEFRNLAAEPEMTPIVLDMTRKLLDHRMENADQTLATTMITAKGPVRGSR
ncbi:sulfatase-like hydrolase/transferase [Pseudohalocynthiibacter sp. F2068]|uniref:sulfatase-like hydrolase/transferase n=1 Tax=Pseudohalocynthiibacter sp. F2068 TaxID=2926418 RepID=UPI001FF2B8C6|nr:sulfatase-like hydrolase/transferase [Pseudohalocynthiibacter sp. F2068]